MRLLDNSVESEAIGFEGSVQAQIKSEKLGFIWDALTTSFYQNPVGSAVRESANNVEDANTAAGSGAVCQIRFDHSDSSIHFIDKGPGMAPEFMRDTYMSLGESTKTDSDAFIGGFGMGRFSVLAYTNTYYIDTVVDGVRYSYMLSKTGAIPDLDLLDETPTDAPTGTDVWFYVKSGDYSRFRDAARHQLKYFDSAFLEGFGDLPNDYVLLKGEHFIFRPDTDTPGGRLEVCYGKNVYPIDWHSLGMEPVELNCAVYFEIGRLDLIRNREQLRYTDRTITALKEGIQALKQELTALYEKDQTVEPDLLTYLARRDKPATIRFTDPLSNEYDLVVDRLGIKSNLVWEPIQHLNLTVPLGSTTLLESVSFHWHKRYSTERHRYSKPDPLKRSYFPEFYYAASGNFTDRKNREIGHYAAVVTPRPVINVSADQIPSFYKDSDLKRRYLPEQRDGLGQITQEGQFVIENPRGIDWEAEIKEFHQIVRAELVNWYKDYDSVVVTRTQRVHVKRQDDEVLCSLNGNSRRNVKLSTLRWGAVHLVFCETPGEVDTIRRMLQGTPYQGIPPRKRTYSRRRKARAERLRQKKTKYSAYGNVVATVLCPKKYRAAILALPNVMHYDGFWKTKVFRRMVQRADGQYPVATWQQVRSDLEDYNPRKWKMYSKLIDQIPRAEYQMQTAFVASMGRQHGIPHFYPDLADRITADHEAIKPLMKAVERFSYRRNKIGRLLQSFAYLQTKYQTLKRQCHGESSSSVQTNG